MNEAFNLLVPLPCSPGKQHVFVVDQEVSESAGWTHHRGQTTQAEFHPAVGTFRIGEHAGFQHHQPHRVVGDGLDVVDVRHRALVLNALVMLKQDQWSAQLSQQR